MLNPRRMSLQLTPLLDMLLIIVFAQYLEIREKQALETKETRTAVVDLEETRARLKALLAEEELLRSQIDAERVRRLAAESNVATEQQKLALTQNDLDRVLDQQRVVAGLMTEMFQIPTSELNSLLESARVPSLEKSPQEMNRVKEQIRELSMQRGGRMLEHLLSYDEIRKRCDVWDLHIDAQGIATLTAGSRTTRIRIPTLPNEDVDVERFVSEVYAWYRSLPQPKSLVVILLTYDRASRISVMESIRKALPILVSRMQSDHAGQVRFEYADLGFRLE
ncbi:hypothetical protein SH661x_001664 [Planctomicrobium sp. SH661]|uniref:hypothetical protein n=1 Tax=Planctomicrobium sp. SH661 TaxID=3448124 RepID=UPI003F5C8583